MIKIGSKLAQGLPAALERDLQAMGRQIRATMPTLAKRALAGDPDAALRGLERALRSKWSDRRIEGLLEHRGRQVIAASDRDWQPLVRALARGDARRLDREPRVPGALPDGRDLLAAWTTRATGLITSVRDSAIPGLQRDILHAAEQGWTPEQLAKAWARRKIPLAWGTLEGRTKVIAHHQLRSLHAQVQRERASAVGVREFEWRTQGDDRVRDEHQALDGTRHRYDSPPSEGLPGEPVNCRCWAESVVTDDVLAELGIETVIGDWRMAA